MKICISLCARNADDLFTKIAAAELLGDVIELRFDCLNPDQIDTVIENLPVIGKTYLLTYRPSEQGGMRVLPLNARLMFWKKALPELEGRDILIDLEADINFPFRFDETKVIRSAHFFNDPPNDLRPAFFELADLGDGIVKIAAYASDITDTTSAWKLLETAAREERTVIPISMGEAGKITRILGPARGAFMTYAALDDSDATAPGQITADDLANVFRIKDLNLETKVHGIVAGNTSYSISPWMHNAGFRSARENRVFVPLQVADLDAFIKRMVRPGTREIDLNFGGFSVTNPHKQAIIVLLDGIDETAEKIGAVNTVKIEDGKLFGYNTDAPGFIAPLKNVYGDLNNAKVAVVGAGGAARACVHTLTEQHANVTVFARDTSKAKSLAESFNVQIETLPDDFRDFDIVVNCTPLGTKGDTEDKTIATANQLTGVKLVYDLVYNPIKTQLIREAKQAGVQTLGGLEMLIAQGAEQFRIWTGREAPLEAMTAAVKKKLNL
ncbi:MAG TPA: shikimate dehydrogenase [Pyrinomonadaceae bacterium]|nr:shikimate dehydrogenase [Pyrinomonadaceae bacterium]